MTRFVVMDQLVRDLKELAARSFPKDDVNSYLRETLIEPSSLAPYVHAAEDHYTRNLVHKDEDFELLVICWDSGQRAPIHGHEGELCWARVERGKLRFKNYEVVTNEPVELRLIGNAVDGPVGFLDGPADIHSVENVREFDGPAASLHVYSKPYASCDIYDSEHGPKRRVRLAYDTVHGKAVTPRSS
jgi:cysteine dioxygenase